MTECTGKHYRIVRFRNYWNRDTVVTRRIIKKRVTLEEARAHCQDDKTHGLNWFDGYEDLTD
jgi:hypothetical protein